MKALITGASSGIGKEMAIYLASLGYDLILVARRKDLLDDLKKKLETNVTIYSYDLTEEESIYKLYNKVKKDDIDILINNAGFGLFGNFADTNMDRELEMLDLNVKAYHILTKLFLKDFVKKDSGHILNVCSSAGFMPGPGMATYYSTKNYVTSLTLALSEELRSMKSKVKISALCPGPVETEFNKVAKGTFVFSGLNATKVAKYAVDRMLKGKLVIIPSLKMKLCIFFIRFVPRKILLRIVHKIQIKKKN